MWFLLKLSVIRLNVDILFLFIEIYVKKYKLKKHEVLILKFNACEALPLVVNIGKVCIEDNKSSLRDLLKTRLKFKQWRELLAPIVLEQIRSRLGFVEYSFVGRL